MNSSSINYMSVVVGLVAVLAVGSYAFMVLRSTRHAVISTLVIGAAAAFVAVVFGTIVLPYITFQPAPSKGVRPYTTMELVGRAVYLREGCWYCHSQFVRQQDRDLGPIAEAGDYVYDSPHALGTERTGPDLSNEGGKFPDEWHEIHISHPRSVRPGSVMASFAFLNDRYPTDSENHRFKYFDSKYQTWRDATDMDCLVVYLQSLGRRKAVTDGTETDVPWEYRFVFDTNVKKYVPRQEPSGIPYASRQIVQGEGMFNQFCAPCHGLSGRGDGYAGRDMWIPPANFTLPKYADYSEAKWYWRISEGIPGAQMPRWGFELTPEQRWYLVRFLQYINATSNLTLGHNADLEKQRAQKDAGDRKGVVGSPPSNAWLFTPAPAGANPGGDQPSTLPVELVPKALLHPGAPAPTTMEPTFGNEHPGVGLVPGGLAPGEVRGAPVGASNPAMSTGFELPAVQLPAVRPLPARNQSGAVSPDSGMAVSGGPQ